MNRPKDDVTADGQRIVYPIWREDLAEAIIMGKVLEFKRPRIKPDVPFSEDFGTPYLFEEKPVAKSSSSVMQAGVCQLCGHKMDGAKNASKGPDGKACTCGCHKGA